MPAKAISELRELLYDMVDATDAVYMRRIEELEQRVQALELAIPSRKVVVLATCKLDEQT
jgi:hypothetical protein